MAQRGCVCGEIPSLSNRTRVTIIRHHAEAYKPSNSARPAQYALQNSRLIPFGDPEARFAIPSDGLIAPGSVLVFPSATNDAPLPTTITDLIIVDGTWSQAKHMVQRIVPLRSLPRLSVTATATAAEVVARPRMRRAPPGGLSTMEAIAEALALVGEPEHRAPLLALYELIVARMANDAPL